VTQPLTSGSDQREVNESHKVLSAMSTWLQLQEPHHSAARPEEDGQAKALGSQSFSCRNEQLGYLETRGLACLSRIFPQCPCASGVPSLSLGFFFCDAGLLSQLAPPSCGQDSCDTAEAAPERGGAQQSVPRCQDPQHWPHGQSGSPKKPERAGQVGRPHKQWILDPVCWGK
jgi:hypothetical protein